jgi:hypothetical protein
MQVVPNSGFFTNLDMMINFVTLRGKFGSQPDFVEDLLIHLNNTQSNGYVLARKKVNKKKLYPGEPGYGKKKVATKKKKS